MELTPGHPAVVSPSVKIYTFCGISIQFDFNQVSSSLSSLRNERRQRQRGSEGEAEAEMHVDGGIRSGVDNAICLSECVETGVRRAICFLPVCCAVSGESGCLLFEPEWLHCCVYHSRSSASNLFGARVTHRDCLPLEKKNNLSLRLDLCRPGNQSQFNAFRRDSTPAYI